MKEALTFSKVFMLIALSLVLVLQWGNPSALAVDDDLDGIPDDVDNCLGIANPGQEDSDVGNLALNRPAWASGEYLDMTADKAFDGDPLTGWNGGGWAGHWIAVDLGWNYAVSQIKLPTPALVFHRPPIHASPRHDLPWG